MTRNNKKVDADNNGYPDVDVVVNGHYTSSYAEDANGDSCWALIELQSCRVDDPALAGANRSAPDGDVVWEYVNPYFVAPPLPEGAPPANRVFRAYRYSRESVEG